MANQFCFLVEQFYVQDKQGLKIDWIVVPAEVIGLLAHKWLKADLHNAMRMIAMQRKDQFVR